MSRFVEIEGFYSSEEVRLSELREKLIDSIELAFSKLNKMNRLNALRSFSKLHSNLAEELKDFHNEDHAEYVLLKSLTQEKIDIINELEEEFGFDSLITYNLKGTADVLLKRTISEDNETEVNTDEVDDTDESDPEETQGENLLIEPTDTLTFPQFVKRVRTCLGGLFTGFIDDHRGIFDPQKKTKFLIKNASPNFLKNFSKDVENAGLTVEKVVGFIFEKMQS